MPHNPEAFADMVALTIKASLAPLLERIAGLDARVTQALAVEASLQALRDRVVAMETKAATVTVPELPDVAPIVERLADVDGRLARLAGLEATLGEVRDRVLTIETKAAIPAEPKQTGPTATEIELQIKDALEPVRESIHALGERVAVLTVREPIPGPPGPSGKDGLDGKDGKDGVDGAGWDDLAVKHDGERTFTVQLIKGERVKDAGTFTIPAQIWRGIYTPGRTYEPGDTVTYARSLWHCIKTTSLKPDASNIDVQTGKPSGGQGKDFWKLVAKGGENGKDGRDAATLPVVSVGRPAS